MSEIELFTRPGWGGNHPASLSIVDRSCHTYVIGKTGSGKSTLLRNLLVQEINLGRGIGLIDPHGDLATELLDFVPQWRTDDVVYFNPGDLEFPCGLNVLRPGLPPDLIASSIVGSLKNIWRDSWGPRLEYILYASVAALAECENVSLLGIPRLLTDGRYRAWVIRQVKDPVVHAFWSEEFESYDKRFRTEAVSPILNKIGQFLMSPVIRNILGQVRNRIDFNQVLNREQIFIANLSKARLGEEHSSLIGSLLVSQFQLAAMGRSHVPVEERKPFTLVIDEFQNFLTESFCTILAESRKYGLHMTLSHQYLDQLRPEIRSAVLGNVGSLVVFRVGVSDAEVLYRELALSDPTQLVNLAKFEVFVKLSMKGDFGEEFRGHSLPPLGKQFGASSKIIARSRERFSRPRKEVEQKLHRWVG